MKISFGTNIVKGPWGGGNLFLINLQNYLTEKGHEVVFGLEDEDIDVILFTDPRKGIGSTSLISTKDITRYKKNSNKDVIVVQRINECDERKNTKKINKLYKKASEFSNHVVFVSKWLQNIYLDLGMNEDKTSVIMSGSDSKVFNSYGRTQKPADRKFRVVTHHWSSNWMKGFELYLKLDKKLGEPNLKNKIEFTYIGNVDKNYQFENTKIIPPLSGLELASELKEHDIYITGSLNEPSGNHHIEGALCGLPILYINSGGIAEYCKDYGLEINLDNFEEKILYMVEYYEKYKNKMGSYPYESNKMSEQYLKLFKKLLDQ